MGVATQTQDLSHIRSIVDASSILGFGEELFELLHGKGYEFFQVNRIATCQKMI